MMRLAISLIIVLVSAFFFGCSPEQGSSKSTDEKHNDELVLVDQAVNPDQLRLLELAFSGVSEMPLHPHIKNRSRAQMNLVEGCLELHQPSLALEYIKQIENWQRWLGYAHLAFYLIENNQTQQANEYIEKAEKALQLANDLHSGNVVAATENPLIDTLKDWRYQAVLSRLAEARLLNRSIETLHADAQKFGEVNAADLMLNTLDTHDFDEAMKVLRVGTDDPSFEVVHLCLLKMAELMDLHYSSVPVSQILEDDVFPKLGKSMPVFLRLDVLLHFADVAVAHGDLMVATSLTDQMEERIEKLKSSPRYYIPEMSRLAQLRIRMEQAEEAALALDEMRELYESKREIIVNIDRAGLLCELAETAAALGDPALAVEFYARAVEEAQANPNSRPQAEDLGRICRSLAQADVKPSPELWAALTAMRSNLGNPW